MEASNAAKQITLLFGMIPPPKKKKAAEIIKVISVIVNFFRGSSAPRSSLLLYPLPP